MDAYSEYEGKLNFKVGLKGRSLVDFLRARVLIGDPDPDISTTLQRYFEANGHEVRLVELASNVLKTARQWQPNAILISTEFTDTDPYSVCREVLADTLSAHIPIIMMLHLDDRRARLDSLEAGADEAVVKPFDIEELRLRVEAAVRLSTQHVKA